MARKKVTPPLTEEEKIIQAQKKLENELYEIIRDYKIPVPTNPDRVYVVGDRVQYGLHDKSIVLEVTDDKRFYKLEITGIREVYGIETPYHEIHWHSWVYLFPYVSPEDNQKREIYSIDNDVRLVQYNTSIDSLYSMVYRFGVDFDAEYQRGYVWSLEDKESLIDSIFNNIEIGKFLFVRREWNELVAKQMNGYEILDGKQRLSTILEFHESRFQYKGKYFHQLSMKDQSKFCDFPVTYMEAHNLNEQDRIKLFIRFNTTGSILQAR